MGEDELRETAEIHLGSKVFPVYQPFSADQLSHVLSTWHSPRHQAQSRITQLSARDALLQLPPLPPNAPTHSQTRRRCPACLAPSSHRVTRCPIHALRSAPICIRTLYRSLAPLVAMSSVAEIEVEKKAYQEQVKNPEYARTYEADALLQLDIVRGQLRDDADNAELKALEGELNDVIALLNESIAELHPAKPKSPEPAAVAEPPKTEKWSRENHPAFKKAAPVAEEKEDAPVNYQVNDNVLAKWVSGDRAFYPAKITSITGSSTAPIYIVKFKSYDTTETLRSKDLRPISNKRKADGPPAAAASSAAVSPAPGLVSSADATMYPQANKDNKDEGEAAKPPKPKKIKAKKELEASKNKWQEFNAKSKFGKTKKKESMFRTPDGIHGRGKASAPLLFITS